MFAVKRNQVVVTALAVMIAAAGYLNFTESRSSGDITDVDLNDPTSYEALLNDDGSIATIADDCRHGRPGNRSWHRRHGGGL